MKKIYTSNYARHSANPNAIGISLIVPEWYEGTTQPNLAPTSDMVFSLKRDKKGYNQRKYVRDYIDLMHERKINPHKLVKSWEPNTILLCYETPTDFCHRRILADWIQEHTGFVIPEWQNEKELELSKQNDVVDSIVSF